MLCVMDNKRMVIKYANIGNMKESVNIYAENVSLICVF